MRTAIMVALAVCFVSCRNVEEFRAAQERQVQAEHYAAARQAAKDEQQRIAAESEDTRRLSAIAFAKDLAKQRALSKPMVPTKAAPVPLAAVAPQAIVLNPTWSTAAWFVDPANTTGCANDGNNCTSSTCGSAGTGVGPCATWHQINDIRWGCLGSPKGCPRLRQSTTVTFLSSHSSNADPLYLYPTIENGGSLVIKANLPTASLLNKNFTSANTQWTGTCTNAQVRDTVNTTIGTANAVIIDQGADGTGTSAWMWCNETSSGTTICRDTPPMTLVTAPPTSFQTPAIWTQATGGANSASGLGATDSYSQYLNLVAVNVVAFEPVLTDLSSSTPNNGGFLYHINVYDPAGAGVDEIAWGPGVTGYEMRTDRVIHLTGNASPVNDGCVNCNNNGGLIGGRMNSGKFWHWNGGMMTSSASICNVTGNGVAIDGWATLFATCTFLQGVQIGLLYDVSGSATITTAGYSELSAISPGYGSVQNGEQFCSSNVLNVLAGTFAYDSSHSGATGVFGSSPAFELAGSATAISTCGTTTQTLTAGVAISQTTLDTACSSSNFGGSATWKGACLRAK